MAKMRDCVVPRGGIGRSIWIVFVGAAVLCSALAACSRPEVPTAAATVVLPSTRVPEVSTLASATPAPAIATGVGPTDTPAANPTEVVTAAPSAASTVPAAGTPAVTPNATATDTPIAAPTVPATEAPAALPAVRLQEYPVPAGSHPHDVAPAADGRVWYTAQNAGALGRLDPKSGETHHIALGAGSSPHGVIVGPDGAAWVTDGGLNAIVRVDALSEAVTTFPLPAGSDYANLNTATFDGSGILWFTGQSGIYGRLDPASGDITVTQAPRGRGPYGISTTPAGEVYYASLAGSYVGRIDLLTGVAAVLEPPTSGQGARRVWPDSEGRLWVSEWNAGNLACYDPARGQWQEWRLPGAAPRPYAVYVDERDLVWLSDFATNALLRFDPATETFDSFVLPSAGAAVRQLLGRPGEVWGAESGTDRLVVARSGR